HLLAKLLELGSSDSRARQFHTIVTPGKYAVAGLMLIKYAALAEWRNIKPLFWLRIGGKQQRKQRPAIFVSILLPTIQRHFRCQIQTDLFRKPRSHHREGGLIIAQTAQRIEFLAYFTCHTGARGLQQILLGFAKHTPCYP